MYAVIETGGKQYRATEGDVVFLERLKGEPGDIVSFNRILACTSETETDFGRPYLKDTSVEAKILGHGKDKKIVIFKYKAKKGYRKKQGHRQPYTKVRIERIISAKYGVAVALSEDAEEAIIEEAVADAVASEILTEAAEEIIDELEEEAAEDIIEEIAEEAAEDIIEDVIDEIIDETVAEEAIEEIIEDADAEDGYEQASDDDE